MNIKEIFSGANGNGHAKTTDESDDTPETELDTDEIQNIRERLKRKATDPVIPQAVKDRMDSDIKAASKGVSESSRAVQETLCDIDKELDARCDEPVEKPEEEAPA